MAMHVLPSMHLSMLSYTYNHTNQMHPPQHDLGSMPFCGACFRARFRGLLSSTGAGLLGGARWCMCDDEGVAARVHLVAVAELEYFFSFFSARIAASVSRTEQSHMPYTLECVVES
jgi:hypothetical protein